MNVELEKQVTLEVARVVTNSLNWPDPIGTHMLGRDLAVPIDKIVKALLPVIREREAEAWDEGYLWGDRDNGYLDKAHNPYKEES